MYNVFLPHIGNICWTLTTVQQKHENIAHNPKSLFENKCVRLYCFCVENVFNMVELSYPQYCDGVMFYSWRQ